MYTETITIIFDESRATSSKVNKMPSEIGFPMTLTSGVFLKQKPNKQTRHEQQEYS